MTSAPIYALRPVRPGDALQVLHSFSSDPLMARQGQIEDLGQAEQYTQNLVQNPDQAAYAITVEDELVGLVCASIDRSNANGWFWYWMNASHRSRHLCSRAAATLATYLLNQGGLHRLELGARANNPASIKVARAAGFIAEGVEREKFAMDGARVDVHTFARLASDPIPALEPLILSPEPRL